MGYDVYIDESSWFLPEMYYDDALKVMKDLNSRDELKRGGGSTGERWFYWMPADYDETVESVEEILDLLGFELAVEKGIGISIIGFNNKHGDECTFLQSIAPYSSGHIVWIGEDGDRWKEDYNGMLMKRYVPSDEWVRVYR
jgi:hypothetical protein